MLVQLLLRSTLLFAPPSELEDFVPPAMGECTPEGHKNAPIGKRGWTMPMRQETRDRVQRACHAADASPLVCAFADAIVFRESSGRAGVRHRLGPREHGLGAMGLSLRWHRNKWKGKADPDFCKPEVSFAVAHAIWWAAVLRYHARSPLDIQAVYEGKWDCMTDPKTQRRVCYAAPDGNTARNICGRMTKRGYSCHAQLGAKDLGRRIRKRDRTSWALALWETFGMQLTP